MIIAVTGGFLIEFFFAPPDPAYVSTWSEFARSGWTDARAFALANTLDSAFTHLAMAPIVALVFGGVASCWPVLDFPGPLCLLRRFRFFGNFFGTIVRAASFHD